MKGLEKINVNCKEIKEIDLRIKRIFDISKLAKVPLQVKILYDIILININHIPRHHIIAVFRTIWSILMINSILH